MRKVTVAASLLLVVVLFFSIANAQDETPSTTVTIDMMSRYLADDGFVYGNDPVLQVDLYQELGAGFALELWTSLDTSSAREGEGSEVDYLLSWTGEVLPYESCLTIGAGYIDVPDLFSGTSYGIIHVFVEASKDFEISEEISIAPFVRGEFNFTDDGEEYSIFFLGVNSSAEISHRITWNNGIKLAVDPGSEETESGAIAIYNGGLSYLLVDELYLNLSVKVSAPIYDAKDRDEEAVAGIGISWNF